jgi:uroporphyrinogen-III synthase
MSRPLEGRTIALAESRQMDELAQLLANEGAIPLPYPMVSIVDAPDAAPVQAWLDDLCAERFAYVVLMTGEALRRLLRFAGERREACIAALGRTKIITRGPKPGLVLKEIGLTPTLLAPAPTTEGVLETLRREPLQGKMVGVTLYGEANPQLEQFLLAAGAQVRTVMPYIYAPAADDERVADLITRLAGGGVDVLLFTSSAQVDRLYEVAERRGQQEMLRQGLTKTRIAAVGPVLAEHLHGRGATVSICPEQGFVMKNLVQHIKRVFANLPTRSAREG